MVILDHTGLNPQWTEEEVPATRYGFNETGWIDSNLFDGQEIHSRSAHASYYFFWTSQLSHFNPAVIKQLDNFNIFCLPPNTTHMMQPLD